MTETNATWYYGKSGEQIGPIDLAALGSLLQQGVVQPHDPVWSPGMPDWQAASTLPQLAAYISASQPQFAQLAAGQPPLAYQQTLSAQSPHVPPLSMLNYQTPEIPAFRYAGFWLRFVAFIIDYFIIVAVALVIGVVGSFAGLAIFDRSMRGARPYTKLELGIRFGIYVIAWLYYSILESSPTQATIGKMAVGIRVTDLAGQRISFIHAAGRSAGMILSFFTMYIGFLMASWTQRKQALHDIMASCLVIRREPSMRFGS